MALDHFSYSDNLHMYMYVKYIQTELETENNTDTDKSGHVLILVHRYWRRHKVAKKSQIFWFTCICS